MQINLPETTPTKRRRPGTAMPSGQLALRKQITIDPIDAKTLIDYGGGLSAGIRLSAELVRQLPLLNGNK